MGEGRGSCDTNCDGMAGLSRSLNTPAQIRLLSAGNFIHPVVGGFCTSVTRVCVIATGRRRCFAVAKFAVSARPMQGPTDTATNRESVFDIDLLLTGMLVLHSCFMRARTL